MDLEEAKSLLPEFFLTQLTEDYSPEDAERIIAGVATRRKTTLRANASLSTRDEVAAVLDEAGIAYAFVPWYADGFILDTATPRDLWELPAYEDGKLYLQSLSSMIPALVMQPSAGDEICDMCAAPGGKTTQMSAMGGKGCYITACEMNLPRAEKLEYNLAKQGSRGVNVMKIDARNLDSFLMFGKVLLDAPCSGSGTIYAADPKLTKRLNPGLLTKCRKQQGKLLAKALQVVKPGGTLVYSTCSVLKSENEDQVNAALSKLGRRAVNYRIESIEIAGGEDIPTLPSTIDGALTVCPTELYEGFFACKIVREA